MKTTLKLVAGFLLVASFAVWVYAYGFVERSTPDLWDDAGLSTQAERVCADALRDLAELPNALEAADAQDRSEQITTSTERLGLMVDELGDLAPATTRDRSMQSAWIDDWRTFIADRYRYADAIAVDQDAQFLLTNVGPERLDRRLDRFANTNKMYSCVAPTDV